MLLINCPHCHTGNRVPANRLSDAPTCGKCKLLLFIGQPVELAPTNVAATIEKNDIPVVVDCWAPWCGPCQGFAPVFSEAAKLFEPKIRFAKLNTESAPSIAQRWQIRSIPTLIIFKQGKEQTRLAGAMPMPQLKQWLGQNGLL